MRELAGWTLMRFTVDIKGNELKLKGETFDGTHTLDEKTKG